MATKRKTEAEKVKTGRPTDYRQELCTQVMELGMQGKSKTQIARTIGVVRNTLDNWAKEHPEFLSALTCAMEWSQAAWEDKADDGIASMGFNAGLWGRVMSARFPKDYRETTRTELTGADGGSVKTEEIGNGFGGFAALVNGGLKEANKTKGK